MAMMGRAAASASTVESQPKFGKAPNPLVWAYPSPFILFNYPLFATNVRILCEKDGWKAPAGQSSLMTTIASLRLTYETEGILGLYRGGHLYLLHQVLRESLRLGAVRCAAILEPCLKKRWQKSLQAEPEPEDAASPLEATAAEQACDRWLYWAKMLTKYSIDIVCYPLLLASTRTVILKDQTRETLQLMRLWSRVEGPMSLFNGLGCSLASTALDEAMDIGLASCIDRFSAGTELEMADKVLLKASAVSVVSIFTSPINYVGVIQRCQSSLPDLLEHTPILNTVLNLPWTNSVYQFFLFAGILALNMKMVQWKLEMQAEEAAADNFDADE